jgi:hypothetical protein
MPNGCRNACTERPKKLFLQSTTVNGCRNAGKSSVLSFIWSPRMPSPVVAPAGPARQAELEPSEPARPKAGFNIDRGNDASGGPGCSGRPRRSRHHRSQFGGIDEEVAVEGFQGAGGGQRGEEI